MSLMKTYMFALILAYSHGIVTNQADSLLPEPILTPCQTEGDCGANYYCDLPLPDQLVDKLYSKDQPDTANNLGRCRPIPKTYSESQAELDDTNTDQTDDESPEVEEKDPFLDDPDAPEIYQVMGLTVPRAGGKVCEVKSDCGNHARCHFEDRNDTQGICECDDGWTNEDCDHKEKSKLAAFLLSLFLGKFGVDRFFLGYVAIGVIKCIIGVLGCCGGCVVRANEDADSKAAGGVGLFGCAIFIWWLIDWILILTNNLPDGYGYPLYQDM